MIIKEHEIKVLVDIDSGNTVIDELINAKNLGSFDFGPPVSQEIEDIYLDYNDFFLKNNNSYLRIRGRKDLHTITFRKEVIKHDILEVDEVTHPLSDEGLKIIIKKIETLKFLRATPVLFKPTFLEVFQTIGLHEKLRVNINRVEKELFVEDVKVGKIKIDKFYYYLKKKDIYYVIEVDTYKKAYYPSVDKFITTLSSQYGDRVSLGHKNKYNRGIALLNELIA